MEEIEIKNLLDNLTVTPSPRCWQAIEAHLPVLPASSVSQAAVSSARHTVFHFSSAAAKWMIGIAAAVATTAAITFALLQSPHTTPDPQPQSLASVVPVGDSASITENNPQPQSLAPVVPARDLVSITENRADLNSEKFDIFDIFDSVPTSDLAVFPDYQSNSIFAPNVPVPTSSTSSKDVQEVPEPISVTTSAPASHNSEAVKDRLRQDPVVAEGTNMEMIDFTPPVILEIPNVITPNGDGYNDFFVIKGVEGCDNSRLVIRNNKGNIIFEKNHYDNSFDASNNSSGIYYYQFFYTVHGINEVRTGTLTILKD
ncbi:MAG TPA: gliding motility-associated C-terminal domain-containing protein [Bacteroidales bacterium]|nr:gliding motility-associated C-terminal domain-containing protein [Bacteroidales bacterium]